MALGAIELATISRSQDYTTIKHNEDNKGMVDQANFGEQVQKSVEQQAREVRPEDLYSQCFCIEENQLYFNAKNYYT